MVQFYPLRVTGIKRETRDAVAVTLEPEAQDAEHFDFIQGQYLTFRRLFDDVELRRCYSICAAREGEPLRVGIKRVDGGTFSTWANEELKVGDVMEAMPPMGNFHAPLEPQKARTYLGFAGGSGITPVLSLIKTVLAEEPNSTFTLVYANRSTSAIMFREELEDLKNIYMGRLSVLHILESEAEIELFSGWVTREKCDALFSHWIDIKSVDLAFICGPQPMMLTISEALEAHGLAKDKIKFELFKSDQPGRAKRKAVSKSAETREAVCEATVILDGSEYQVSVQKDDQSVLDAALAAGLNVPYSCKAGVCSTCRAMVREGEVDMEANHALEEYEIKRGYVLACQSYCVSNKLTIDFSR